MKRVRAGDVVEFKFYKTLQKYDNKDNDVSNNVMSPACLADKITLFKI